MSKNFIDLLTKRYMFVKMNRNRGVVSTCAVLSTARKFLPGSILNDETYQKMIGHVFFYFRDHLKGSLKWLIPISPNVPLQRRLNP